MPITQQAAIHYPISLLDVGDSFFVPALKIAGYVRHMDKMADKLGFTLQYRCGIDTATGLYGIRVTRII